MTDDFHEKEHCLLLLEHLHVVLELLQQLLRVAATRVLREQRALRERIGDEREAQEECMVADYVVPSPDTAAMRERGYVEEEDYIAEEERTVETKHEKLLVQLREESRRHEE